MRRPIIAGNWKMNKTVAEARELVGELLPLIKEAAAEVVICPVHTALYPVSDLLQTTQLMLGAQNMYWEENGAFTGEVSPLMLAEIGCRYVILGHSERRQLFGETDAGVNRKIKAAFAAELRPILCVGETLQERTDGSAEAVIEGQLQKALAGLDAEQAAGMIIAYEPIWAIGTGETASAADAEAMCAFIRSTVEKLFDLQVAETVRIQYGGSVKPGNIAELMKQPDIDGALVGGASLDAADFAAIVNY